MCRRSLIVLLPLLAMVAVSRARNAPLPEVLLRAADRPRHVLEEGVLRIHVAAQEKGKPPSASDLDVYVKGSDRVLCAFREGTQKGRKVLMVGERVWLLVPGAAQPIPVSAHHRLLGGASVADLGRLSFAQGFDGTVRAVDEMVEGTPCHVVDLRAKAPTAPYASGTLWVGSEDSLARKALLALRSGKNAKEIRFVEYGQDLGQTVLRRMEIRHLLFSERGLVTVVEFVRYERRSLEDGLFDPVRARDLP